MTVTISQNVRDITGASDSSMWWFSSPLREIDGTAITPREIVAAAVNGVLTVELTPGPATVRFANVTYSFTVPDVDAELWPLIEAGVIIPPETPTEVLTEALTGVVAAYFEANPIGGGGSLPDAHATGDCWGLPGAPLSHTPGDLSLGAGGIYYIPFSTNGDIVVTGARFNVSSQSATAANVRLGIYGADGVGPNANAPLWDSGAISVADDFSGPKYAGTISVDLPAGHYLAAITTDNSILLYARERAGFSFLGDDDQIKGWWFNIFAFGAFPTPGPAALGSMIEPLIPFLLQWTNA